MLTWDDIGTKRYETGLDRGVLYLPDGSRVAWNGLTSVEENVEASVTSTYFDGMKVNDLVTFGEFTATMRAITYPDEFVELEGTTEIRSGFFVGGQKPQTFGLCYRTKISTDLDSEAGYKLHLIYNVTAIPSNRVRATLTDSSTPNEFEWTITAIPEDLPGVRPTAHVVISSLTTDPWLLEELEDILYGGSETYTVLLPMEDLINYISEWYRVKITDNLDGTWTADSLRDGFIDFPWPTDYAYFEIKNVNVYYLDTDTFVITDTTDISEVPEIEIVDNQDGTWIASTDDPTLITVDEITGAFEIDDANVDIISTDEYQISDTPAN